MLRLGAKTLLLKEQVIQTPDGLTLTFAVETESTARYRVAVEGNGTNYEFVFDVEGVEAGGGTKLGPTQAEGEVRE